VTWRAADTIELDPAQGSALLSLLESLERVEDVQSIYTNATIPDEVLESI
jgi:transcriptional/translational regulatory protein YebC/TACO1